jgi:hypothetical protein
MAGRHTWHRSTFVVGEDTMGDKGPGSKSKGKKQKKPKAPAG